MRTLKRKRLVALYRNKKAKELAGQVEQAKLKETLQELVDLVAKQENEPKINPKKRNKQKDLEELEELDK